MIDADGFRPNVGIIVCNDERRVLWARRHRQTSWQFPQGGIKQGESPSEALYRELREEVGLKPDAVDMLAQTEGWLHYRLPEEMLRAGDEVRGFVGQKQKWFLLRMVGQDSEVRMDCSDSPEFDKWKWVNYWYPVSQIVAFKRDVYRSALRELAPHLPAAA